MNLRHIARRNLSRHKSQSIRNIIAVSIPSVILMLLLGIIGGIEKDMESVITHYLAGDIRIQNKAYAENEIFNPAYYLVEEADNITEKISSVKEVGAVSQKLFFPVTVQDGKLFEQMTVLGIDFNAEQKYNDFKKLIVEGRVPVQGTREILVGTLTAEEFGFKIGDTITFFGSTSLRGQNGMSAMVVGIVQYPSAELNKRKFVLPLDIAQYFFKSPDAVTEIDVRKQDGTMISTSLLQKKIRGVLRGMDSSTLQIETWKEVSAYYAIFQMGRVIYFIIGLVFCILGSLILYNTMSFSLYSRKFELGVLYAMGFSNGMLRKMFQWEVLIIVILGSLWGVAFGAICVALLGQVGIDMLALGSSMDGTIMSRYQYPHISVLWTVIIFFYTAIASFFIGSAPVRKLKKETALSLLRAGFVI